MTVGTPLFEEFAKAYVLKFARTTVTSGEFRDFFLEYIAKNGDNKAITAVGRINWDDMLHKPGMPLHDHPDFTTQLATNSLALADKWKAAGDTSLELTACRFAKSDIEGWSTGQSNVFLDTLLLHCTAVAPLSAEKLEHMDMTYGYSQVQNSEIKFRWQCLCLKTGVTWIVPQVLDFVRSQGRMKFVRPLYRALNGCSAVNGTQVAKTAFVANHHTYHPIARKMLQVDLGITEEELTAAATSPSSQETSTSSTGNTALATTGGFTVADLFSKFTSSWISMGLVAATSIGALSWLFFFNKKSTKK